MPRDGTLPKTRVALVADPCAVAARPQIHSTCSAWRHAASEGGLAGRTTSDGSMQLLRDLPRS
jgi:hypothetical protein